MRLALDGPDKAIAILKDHRDKAEPAIGEDDANEVAATAERIAKDPLSRHKLAASATANMTTNDLNDPQPIYVSNNAASTVANASKDSDSSCGSSSRLASEAKECSLGSTTSTIKPGASFKVFSDVNVLLKPSLSSAETTSAPVKSSALGSTLLSTLPASKSAKPFSIFQDTENFAPSTAALPPATSQYSSHGQSASASASRRVLSPAPQAESNVTADTADDNQIQDLLNELGILDSEDGTINTRLARRDIDSLFTSDSPESSFLNHQVAESMATHSRSNTSSPKPLPIPSYAGGAFPHRSDAKTSSLAQFGGNDLSIIEEVNST